MDNVPRVQVLGGLADLINDSKGNCFRQPLDRVNVKKQTAVGRVFQQDIQKVILKQMVDEGDDIRVFERLVKRDLVLQILDFAV